MRIIVDGKEAVLKAGSSFEYISENPLFTEAEGYSLEIEFPLKDCPENILIFGALHVQGVDLSRITFPCELDAGTFRKTGFLTIVEINEVEVKGQFLEGMSTGMFDSDVLKFYIDEFDYSDYDGSDETETSVYRAMGSGWAPLVVWDSKKDRMYGRGQMEQDVMCKYVRHVSLRKLIELVGIKSGLSVDMSALDEIPFFGSIIVANSTYSHSNAVRFDESGHIVSGSTYYVYRHFMDLEKCLPHWTVKELMQEVGSFFGCLVHTDSLAGKISFVPYKNYAYGMSMVSLPVNDDFTVEMQDGSDSGYGDLVRVKFPDDCNPDNVNQCNWFMNNLDKVKVQSISSYNDFVYQATHRRTSQDPVLKQRYIYQINGEKVALIEMTEGKWDDNYVSEFAIIEPLNQYGSMPEDGKELKLIPCPMVYKSLGMGYVPMADVYRNQCFDERGYLSTGELTHAIAYKFPVMEVQQYPERSYIDGKTDAWDLLQGGEEKYENKFDKLLIVLHSGTMESDGSHVNTRQKEPDLGTEYAAETVTAMEGKVPVYHKGVKSYTYTLAPTESHIAANMVLPNVNETQLYRYKFLGTTIPSPTSVFLINGQKFACLRITAHFTPSGMSELLEGEFYRIID